MTAMKIEAKLTDSEPVSVDYDFGDTLAQAVEKFGEEVVFTRYKAAAVIDLQAYMRNMIRSEKSEDDIRSEVAAWVPGIRQSKGKSKEEKAREILSKLSAEERAAILAEFAK